MVVEARVDRGLEAKVSTIEQARPVSARHRATADPRAGNLKARFHPRYNHLSSIRLVLAFTVAMVHGLQIGYGWQPELGNASLGDLAVDAFFVLSGFLLAGSMLRLDSIRRYAWHRFLRIMPGFWVCLLVTALAVAPVIAALQDLPATSVLSGDKSSIHFLMANSMLLMREFGVAGLPTNVHEPGVLNGSLWTLFYEALCYVGVVGLSVIGALKRWPWITVVVTCLIWCGIALTASGFDVGSPRLLRFGMMFLVGSVFMLYADRIPIHGGIAAVSAVLLVVGLLLLPDYRALAAPAFGYLCLWIAVVRPPKTVMSSDFSYGLYVYHWPVMQIMVVSGVTGFGQVMYLIIGGVVALSAAFLSWDLVERPALGFKNAAWVTANSRRRPEALR